ncbi:hypothetical protein D3C84_1223350 [compost metagenome]
MITRHDIVCHGLAAAGIDMRKEGWLTPHCAFFIGEGQAFHPTLLEGVLVELADVSQALASGGPCQFARR